MAEFQEVMKKMCVIGDAAVGKTSLIRRFVIDKFDDKYIVTIGTKTSKKIVKIKGKDTNVNLKLMIWDLLGQSQFFKIKEAAFKGADGAFIVLDLTKRETLQTFDNWLSSLYGVTPGIPVVVLANKCDLDVQFGKVAIDELVAKYGFPYFITSAKTGENVDIAFSTLGKMLLGDWKGGGLSPQFKNLNLKGKTQDEVTEPNKKLTALDVEDMIMARFCDLLEDPEYAMAIIREQFKRANVNFKNPSPEGLSKVVDYLINAASDQVEANRLQKEKRAYSDLIRMIGKGGSVK